MVLESTISASNTPPGPKNVAQGAGATTSEPQAAASLTSAVNSGGFTIDIDWDSSVSSAPAGFKSAVEYAVGYLESTFSNPVTITIDVGWGEIDGSSLGSDALGESLANYTTESYSTVVSALRTDDAPGASELTPTPADSGTLVMAYAEAQALGLMPSSAGVVDGWVGFSNSAPWSFTPNVTPSADEYYLIGVVEHEITEDMGRVSQLDPYGDYAVIDLYRYLAAGEIDTKAGGPDSTAYFSINLGATNLGSWNNDPNNGDLADWYPAGPAPGGDDAFNDYSNPGVINIVSTDDLILLSALGWTGSSASSFVVSSGQIFTSAIGSADSVTVLSGGETSGVVNGGHEYASSGGLSVRDTVASGGVLAISSGARAQGAAIESGGVLLNAGSTSDDLIEGVGSETTLSGGSSLAETIDSGGYAIVSPGGEAAAVSVSGGGSMYVWSGATLSGGLILSGGVVSGTGSGEALEGEVVVSSGGLISGFMVESGGELVLGSGATDDAITVASGGAVVETLVVPYGALLAIPASPATATANVNNLTVDSGGGLTVTRATVVSSATLIVEAGALADDVFVSSTGTLSGPGAIAGANFDYGLVSGVEIEGGAGLAELLVGSGGAAIAVSLSGSGAELQIMPGGSAVAATLSSGGVAVVSSGALESGGAVLSGGLLDLLSGGQLMSAPFAAGAALELPGPIVSSGQTLSVGPLAAAESLSGAILAVGAAVDYASPEVLGDGSLDIGAGGLASGAILFGGALASAQAGGVLDALTVEPGAKALLSPGADLNGASIRGGVVSASGAILSGLLTVLSGGVLSGGLLRGGGVDVEYAGASETLDIEAGGTLELVGFQVAPGATEIAGSLPTPETIAGVSLSAAAVVELASATVSSGGALDVLAHGTATYLAVQSAGRAAVSSGGVVGGAVISAGGVISGPGDLGGTITDAGSVMGAVIFGTITVESGGLVSGGFVRNAGTYVSALAGATVSNLQVLPYATLDLASGASAFGAAIFGSAILSAQSGASVDGAIVELQGEANLSPGVSVFGLSISNGGVALASGATLSGVLTVFSGGEIIGGTLGSGTDVEYAGAAEQGVLVASGAALELVSALVGPGVTIVAGDVSAAETLSGVRLASGAVIELVSASVSSGGVVSTLTDGEVDGAVVAVDGEVSGPGALYGTIADAGEIVGGQLLGAIDVSSGGVLSGGFLRAGATAQVVVGGSALGVDVLSGASLVDNGTTLYSAGGTIAGVLTGAGALEETGPGALAISSGAGFAGKVVISAGTVTLAGAGGVGSSQIVFSGVTSAAELVIGVADTPAAGSTYAAELVGFANGADSVDLAGLAFVSGASAHVAGSTLVLADGGQTYDFALGGAIATSYAVAQDGAGTLITADRSTQGDAAQLVQAMATFGASGDHPGAATGSGLVSSAHPLTVEPAAHAAGVGRT